MEAGSPRPAAVRFVLGGISSGGHGLNLTASGTITLMDGVETAVSNDFFYD